jgi:hypothetical protein
MITAIVNFKLPADIDAKKAAELFKGSAPKYRGMKGLIRKYYLFDASAAPRRLDRGDVDLAHRHHRLEGALGLVAARPSPRSARAA